jgi:hypothetical protein
MNSKWMAAAVSFLALSFLYFGYQIGQLAQVVPPLIALLDKDEVESRPIVEEIREIRLLIPKILDVASKIQEQVPAAVQAVDKAAVAVSAASVQVAGIRPLVPKILDESEKIRLTIPEQLNHVDSIVQQSKVVVGEAKKIGENAGAGVITGILKSPFTIVSSVGSGVADFFKSVDLKLNEEEMGLLTQKGSEVLSSEKLNEKREWQSSTTSRNGSVVLKAYDKKTNCKTIQIAVHSNGRKDKKDVKFCLDSNNVWQPKK